MAKTEETESLRDLAIDAYQKGDNNEAIKLFTKIINIGSPFLDKLRRARATTPPSTALFRSCPR